MSWQAPNLARRPFVNLRPLRRLSALLVSAAVLLTAWNATAYWRSGVGVSARLAEIDRLTEETSSARARLATLESDLASWDLAAENQRTSFLNERIEQRTFGWNTLLDRLAEAQPRGVRLRTLTPRFASPDGDTGAGAGGHAVRLAIAAEAEDDEAMLDLVDALFAHDGFVAPNLARESRVRGGNIAFDLTVDYLPEVAP